MCARHQAAAVLAAAEWLACEGHAGVRFTVTVAAEDVSLSVTCRRWGAPAAAPAAQPPPGFRRLSPLEERIIDGLAGKGWVTTADLAVTIGEELTTDLRVVVRNLADGEGALLETNTRFGVRLRVA